MDKLSPVLSDIGHVTVEKIKATLSLYPVPPNEHGIVIDGPPGLRTGQLREHVTHEQSRNGNVLTERIISTRPPLTNNDDLDVPELLENGSSTNDKYPYMRPARDELAEHLDQDVAEGLRNF